MNYKNEFINQYGNSYSATDLANFVSDNWTGITGGSEENKMAETDCHFPDEVVELMDELFIDYDEFAYEWGDVNDEEEPDYYFNEEEY